jgi:hypothetical protein
VSTLDGSSKSVSSKQIDASMAADNKNDKEEDGELDDFFDSL